MTVYKAQTTTVIMSNTDLAALNRFLADRCSSRCLDDATDRAEVVLAIATWLQWYVPVEEVK